MRTELDRNLWRYKAGYYTENHLIDDFEEEVDRLVAEFTAYAGEIVVMRHRCEALLQSFDKDVSAARTLLNGANYKEALERIKIAQSSLRKLREVIEVNQQYESVKSSAERVLALISYERLRQLPTIKTITQLVSQSDQLLQEGECQQARFISLMCQQDINSLMSKGTQQTESLTHLLPRIKQLCDLCERTSSFVLDASSDFQTNQLIEALNDLLEGKYMVLAERLVDALEVELAPRRTFLNAYTRYQKSFSGMVILTPAIINELRQKISTESWKAASMYLARHALNGFSTDLQSLGPKLSRATRRINALSPPSPAAD